MVNELKNNDTSRYDKNNKDPITSDQALYEIMNVKEGISKQLLKSIKEAAIDCAIHNKSTSKEILECYTFGNETDPKFYSYRPNIENEDRDASTPSGCFSNVFLKRPLSNVVLHVVLNSLFPKDF